MYSNSRKKKSYSTFYDDPLKALPLYSQTKTNKKFQTPHKTPHSTNVTRNASINSHTFTSQRKQSNSKNKMNVNSQTIPLTYPKQRSKSTSTTIKIKRPSQTKSKRRAASVVNVPKTNKQFNNQGLQSNISLYRSTKNSLDSTKRLEIMSKVSKLYDLITLHKDLPPQIELLLREPIKSLRHSLQRSRRGQVAKQLLKFKNQCSYILDQTSSSQICVFLRTGLPESNRWSVTNVDSYRKKQTEKFMREKYFQSLKKKQMPENDIDDRRLYRIEDRLNEFMEKSSKYRKVFI